MFSKIKEIYQALGDDASRRIFSHRLLFNISDDRQHLVDMICSLDNVTNADTLREYAAGTCTAPCVVFGAGSMAQHCIADFNLPVICFCDNDPQKQGTTVAGKPVISFDRLLTDYRHCIVVVGTVHTAEIVRQLREHMFPESQIIACEGAQYFDPVVPHSPNEVFVDAGACDGMNSVDFIQWCGGQFDRIVLLEPDPQNLSRVHKNMLGHVPESISKITCVAAGLGEENGTARFCLSHDYNTRLDEQGGQTIRIQALDSLLLGQYASFVKMDIEGAELAALRGAKETIRVHKPCLAISIYHKSEDILDIPLYILELSAEYVFYLRHYTLDAIETVLYAIPRNK